jgi:aquaporin NIP
MNPARSLGPAIISGNFNDIWIYMTAPTIGALAGALLFRVLRLQQRRQCNPTS